MTDINHYEINLIERNIGEAHLLDVTIRDGGFCNSFSWTIDNIINISRFSFLAGSKYVEVGYIGGVPEFHNISKKAISLDITPSIINKIKLNISKEVKLKNKINLAAMIHPSSINEDIDFHEFKRQGLELVRFVYHKSWYEKLKKLHNKAKEAGLKTSVNIALISRYNVEPEIPDISNLNADYIYLADTCGSLLPIDVKKLFELFSKNEILCFHAHNPLSFALANSITASRLGSPLVDGSILGLGRGGGNMRLEQWLYLKVKFNNSFLNNISSIKNASNYVNSIVNLPSVPDDNLILSGALNLSPIQENDLRNKNLSLKDIFNR